MSTENTRNLILDSAIELFIEKGYHNTSTNDIRIKANNLSRGGLYHHFQKKEDILKAIPSYLNQNDEVINQLINNPKMTTLEKVRQMFTYTSNNSHQKKSEYQYKQLLKDYAFKEIHEKFIKENILPLYVSLLEEGNRDGSISVKHPKYLAPILFQILNNSILEYDTELNTAEDSIEYIGFIKDFLNDNGIPLIDDVMAEAFKNKILLIHETNH